MPTVEYAMFQPFESRKKKDPNDLVYAVKLRGFNQYQDRDGFKAALRTFQRMHKIRNGGGWISSYHRWFVEPEIWPDMLKYFKAIDMKCVEVPITEDELRLEGKRYEYKAALKYSGDGDPVGDAVRYSDRVNEHQIA